MSAAPLDPAALPARLGAALDARADLFDARHEAAFRLFNGFVEGCPALVADLYARTIVLHNYAAAPADARALIHAADRYLRERLPWVRAVVLKERHAASAEARRGVLLHGAAPDRKVREHGVWYALDLLLNRDASLYLDTRDARAWALAHLRDKTVLNTFAYTGSLGVAARAGGARRVVHLDRNRRFLNVAKDSYTLNGLPIDRADFLVGDFFARVGALRRAGARFDCVFVDPPFFSATGGGRVDLVAESHRAIDKVRPLVADGGYLVAINNALFVSGAEYLRALDALCADGYLALDTLIPVPADFTGYDATRVTAFPADPAPFNHPTKIAVLRVRRKDARREEPVAGRQVAGADRAAEPRV